MRQPKNEVIKILVGEWVQKAEQDFKTAEILIAQELPYHYPSCFHSQQAAEKYLKAFLTLRQAEFPKTHSISDLLLLVATVDEQLAEKLKPAASLTPYGVEARYPGDIPEPSRQDAEKALALATSVRCAVQEILKDTV